MSAFQLQLICDRGSVKVAWTVWQIQKCLALKPGFVSITENWFCFHSDYPVTEFGGRDDQKGGRGVGGAYLFPSCKFFFSFSALLYWRQGLYRSPHFVLLPTFFFLFFFFLVSFLILPFVETILVCSLPGCGSRFSRFCTGCGSRISKCH